MIKNGMKLINHSKLNINLYNDDCITIMQKLLDEGVKVDLTVTSPPYDNLRSYNGEVIWDFEKFKMVAKLLYEITVNGGVVIWVVNDQVKNGSETGTSFARLYDNSLNL